MRVLHVVPSLDPASGGPSRSVPDLCVAQSRAGVDVALLSFSDPPITLAGVDAHLVRPMYGTRQGVTPAFARALTREMAKADLVHLHSLWNPPITIAARAARRARQPFVLSPRGMLQDVSRSRKPVLKRLASPMVRAMVSGAAGLHFLTEAELQGSRSFSLGPSAVVVIPNGVDPDLRDDVKVGAFRAKHPEAGDRAIILFLGRLHWSKGLDLQLDAVSIIARSRDDIVWMLVGPDEGEWRELSKEISARGLTDRVTWVGPVSRQESLEALSDSAVVLLTSRHEAHSMAMNEALAMGARLIITETVGFPTLAAIGAARITPSDPERIAVAIQETLEDETLTNEAARRFAREHLAWSVVAEEMIGFYEALLARHMPAGGR